MCMPGTLRSQKRVLDPPELEIQMFLSHYMGAGYRTGVLWKSKRSQPLNSLSCSLSCLFSDATFSVRSSSLVTSLKH